MIQKINMISFWSEMDFELVLNDLVRKHTVKNKPKSYLGLPKLGVDNRIKAPKLSKIIENT